jgi:hypothetical protein
MRNNVLTFKNRIALWEWILANAKAGKLDRLTKQSAIKQICSEVGFKVTLANIEKVCLDMEFEWPYIPNKGRNSLFNVERRVTQLEKQVEELLALVTDPNSPTVIKDQVEMELDEVAEESISRIDELKAANNGLKNVLDNMDV